jgi:hypothetical protein
MKEQMIYFDAVLENPETLPHYSHSPRSPASTAAAVVAASLSLNHDETDQNQVHIPPSRVGVENMPGGLSTCEDVASFVDGDDLGGERMVELRDC